MSAFSRFVEGVKKAVADTASTLTEESAATPAAAAPAVPAVDHAALKAAMFWELQRSLKELHQTSVSLGSGLALRDVKEVRIFCQALERILRHGLLASWFVGESSFWAVAMRISRKDVVNYLKGLKFARSDNARARAWIRLAINEQSLESYITSLLDNHDILAEFYETHAFLRDVEQSSKLQALLASVSFTINFDLNVDDASLEYEPTPLATTKPEDTTPVALPPSSQTNGTDSPALQSSTTNGHDESPDIARLRSGSARSASSGGRSATLASIGAVPAAGVAADSENTAEIRRSEPVPIIKHKKRKVKKRKAPKPLDGEDAAMVASTVDAGEEEEAEDDGLTSATSTTPATARVSTDDGVPPSLRTAASLSDSALAPPALPNIDVGSYVEPVASSMPQSHPVVHTPLLDSLLAQYAAAPVAKSQAVAAVEPEPEIRQIEPAISAPPATIPTATTTTTTREEPQAPPSPPPPQLDFDEALVASTFSRPTPSTLQLSLFMPADHDDFGLQLLQSPEISAPMVGALPQTIAERLGLAQVVAATAPVLTRVNGLDAHGMNPEQVRQVMYSRHKVDLVVTAVPVLVTAPPPPLSESEAAAVPALEQSVEVGTETAPEPAQIDTDVQTEPPAFVDQAQQTIEAWPESLAVVSALEEEAASEAASDATAPPPSQPQPTPTSLPKSAKREYFLDYETAQANALKEAMEPVPTPPLPEAEAQEDAPTADRGFVTPAKPHAAPPPPSSLKSPIPTWREELLREEQLISKADKNQLRQILGLHQKPSSDSLDTPSGHKSKASEDLTNAAGSWTEPSTVGEPGGVAAAGNSATSAATTAANSGNPDVFDGFVMVETAGAAGDTIVNVEEAGNPASLDDSLLSSATLPTPLKRVRDEALTHLLGEEEEDALAAAQEDEKFKSQGHLYVVRPYNNKLCVACGGRLQKLLQHSRRVECVYCKLNVHRRCIAKIKRTCVARQYELTELSMEVCPDRGLAAQEYKCAGCGVDIGFSGLFGAAVLDDYSGKYYCGSCHQGEQSIIPARVVQSWQFQTFPVACVSNDVIAALYSRPCMDLQQLNSSLFQHVEELGELHALRLKLRSLLMFLLSCRFAQDKGLLHEFSDRRHFLMSERWYALKDLVDVRQGDLLDKLRNTVNACLKHVRSECELCPARGSYCQKCLQGNVVYPFDEDIRTCKTCRGIFHQRCYENMGGEANCPSCSRIEARRLKGEGKA